MLEYGKRIGDLGSNPYHPLYLKKKIWVMRKYNENLDKIKSYYYSNKIK